VLRLGRWESWEESVPTYQYACTECGDRLEVVQRFSDDPLTVCAACGGKLRKVFSPVGIVFKGSGFYRTDSRKATGSSANGKSGGENSSGSDSGSESGKKSDSGAKAGADSSSSSSSSSSNGSSGGSSGGSSSGGDGSKGTKSAGSSGTSSKVA